MSLGLFFLPREPALVRLTAGRVPIARVALGLTAGWLLLCAGAGEISVLEFVGEYFIATTIIPFCSDIDVSLQTI